MYLDIERQHMKTTKLKMHPGKAAKKVSMQRLYGQMATEAGEGRKIYIEKETSSRMQQQILMSGFVRKQALALGPTGI